MAKINSRAKGQSGEREVADLLNAAIFRATGVYGDFKRNLEQTQDGGFDLNSVVYPFFAIEVKRVENLTPAVVEKFWKQAMRQSKLFAPPGKYLLPILIYRKSRMDWRIRTLGRPMWADTVFCPVEISQADFIVWFEGQIKNIFERRQREQASG